MHPEHDGESGELVEPRRRGNVQVETFEFVLLQVLLRNAVFRKAEQELLDELRTI